MTDPLLPPRDDDQAGGPTPAQVVFGGLLVLVGVLWLLEALGAADVPWQVVLPIALMAVGGGLLAGAARGAHAGLVTTGLGLTLLLAVGSSLGPLADLPFSGGVGSRVERPATIAEVEASYRLAVGDLEIDLRGVDFPEGTDVVIEASVGIGRLTVRLPDGVNVDGVARVGAGNVVTFGDDMGGVGVEQRFGGGAAGVTELLELELRVGLGEIVVTR